MSDPKTNPYDSPQAASSSPFDWKTWAPFQSPVVREICAHLTPAEKSKATRRGFLYGLWCAISFALPLQLVVFGLIRNQKLNYPIAVFAGLMIVTHLLCIPHWRRRQHEFLCNTDWAQKQGIQPDNMRLPE